MAGFVTLSESGIIKKIKKEVEKYQNINKHKNRNSQTEMNKRQEYLENVKKLFDIAALNLVDILEKDRLLGNDDQNPLYRSSEGYTRKTEDVAFLEDQRGERTMILGEKDATFEARKDVRNQKELKNTGGDDREVNNILNKTQDESEDDTSDIDGDNEKDSDFKVKEKSKKKSDYVIIELPRYIMNNSEVCAMLDRTATTSRKAVGIVSSILKSGKIDGQAADLSKFTLSRPSLERKRVNNRTVLMEQSMQEFQENKPRYPALHWDGALMQDVTGTLQENESILVSGAHTTLKVSFSVSASL